MLPYLLLLITVFTSCRTDPLVHHGRHFGRTVHALCTVNALLNNGLLRMERAVDVDEPLTHEYVFVSALGCPAIHFYMLGKNKSTGYSSASFR